MSVAPTSMRSQSVRPKEKRWLGVDPLLVLITVVMVCFGLVMVYSASWDVSWRLYGDPTALFKRQVINLLVGIAALLAALWIPLRWLRWAAVPVILLAIVSLVVVLVLGGGSEPRRAILGSSVQPSELAKLALIIYLAVWMESKGEKLADWTYGLLPLIGILGIVGGLVLLQPDLSAAITIAIVAFVMFYMAGARWRHMGLVALGSGAVGFSLIRLSTTGRQRWSYFWNGLINVEEASYHVQHSLQAFFSGGLLGRGLGASREKFGLLPAPHTDSIFAVIGEELGLIGAALVLLLFGLLMWRGFRVASRQPERLTVLLGSGITFWIGCEALINMAVLLGLLPFAGNALPFFSYGGSNLVTTLAGMGLLLNVSKQQPIGSAEKRTVAAIGGGRGNRRRRVSRVGRARRTQ